MRGRGERGREGWRHAAPPRPAVQIVVCALCDKSFPLTVFPPRRPLKTPASANRLADQQIAQRCSVAPLSPAGRPGLAVVFEDDHAAVVVKPQGITTQGKGEGSVQGRVKYCLAPSTAEGCLARPHHVSSAGWGRCCALGGGGKAVVRRAGGFLAKGETQGL